MRMRNAQNGMTEEYAYQLALAATGDVKIAERERARVIRKNMSSDNG